MGLPGMGVASGGVAGRAYLSLPGARVGSAMALRRVFLLRSAAPRAQPAASPGAVRAWGAAEAVRRPVPVVDFSNTQEAYRSRRSWELVRNLLVLRLCASRVLLVHHEQVRGGGGGVARWAGAARDIGAASGLPSSEVSGRVTQAWPEAGQARKTAVSCVLPDFVKFPTRSHYQLGRRADSV